jgi:hypothetical protein
MMNQLTASKLPPIVHSRDWKELTSSFFQSPLLRLKFIKMSAYNLDKSLNQQFGSTADFKSSMGSMGINNKLINPHRGTSVNE